MLRMKPTAKTQLQCEFTEKSVARQLAIAGWEEALELSREKGPGANHERDLRRDRGNAAQAPGNDCQDGFQAGDKVPGRILHAKLQSLHAAGGHRGSTGTGGCAGRNVGARFTHHSSIAPTGTISLSLANNASNGIEPSFAHHYFRNVIRPGKKTKEKVDVFSFEMLAYRELVDETAMPSGMGDPASSSLPDYFITADDISPTAHVDIQAAAQKWIDSSISKTANVPTDYPYEDFKHVYLYAYEQGLKGCTTFRFNPEAFQGVLVKEKDLKNTMYTFELADGSTIDIKGDEEIEYDGEVHTAANLFDALKEGYYGKF